MNKEYTFSRELELYKIKDIIRKDFDNKKVELNLGGYDPSNSKTFTLKVVGISNSTVNLDKIKKK